MPGKKATSRYGVDFTGFEPVGMAENDAGVFSLGLSQTVGQGQTLAGQVHNLPASQFYRSYETWFPRELVGKDAILRASGQALTYDWPNPTPPYRMPQSWTWQATLYYPAPVLPEGQPFNQHDWPLPGQPPRLDQSIGFDSVLNYFSNKILGQPFDQRDWPNPRANYRIEQSWFYNGTIRVPPVRLPNNQYNWPNPIPPFRTDQFFSINASTEEAVVVTGEFHTKAFMVTMGRMMNIPGMGN